MSARHWAVLQASLAPVLANGKREASKRCSFSLPRFVDDTATSPGLALQRLASSGALRIRESYGPYDPPSRFNRCLRTYNRGPMCLPWGFSVAQYVQ